MDKLRAQKMYELANRLSQVDSTSLSESQHAEYTAMLEQLHAEAAKLKQGVAEGKEDKIAQLKKDYETAIHWSKNETSPQKREAARQKAEKIKRHLDTQYKQGVAEAGNKPLEKSRFGTGDTRTPRDIKSQMQGASDEFVRSTADKKTGPFHSKVAKMQGKMAKSELRRRDHSVAEGVATSMPMSDAVKLLKQYGADHFKTTTNELHFYKNGQAFSVDLVMNPDTTRSVTLSSLNSATRGLKGQGVTEDIDTEAYDRLKRVFDFSDYKG